jgi:hypothetical protein
MVITKVLGFVSVILYFASGTSLTCFHYKYTINTVITWWIKWLLSDETAADRIILYYRIQFLLPSREIDSEMNTVWKDLKAHMFINMFAPASNHGQIW